MKTWVEPTQVPSKETRTVINQTVSYLEAESYFVNSAHVYYYYVFRFTDTSMLVLAHFGRDEMFQVLEQQLQDPTLAKVYEKTYRETWPAFFAVLDNGINGRYSQGAFLRIADPDNGDLKWMIGTVVGNIDLSSSDAIYKSSQDERISQAGGMVLQLCAQLSQELQKMPSKLKIGLRGAVAGYASGARTATKLAEAWLPALSKLSGG